MVVASEKVQFLCKHQEQKQTPSHSIFILSSNKSFSLPCYSTLIQIIFSVMKIVLQPTFVLS